MWAGYPRAKLRCGSGRGSRCLGRWGSRLGSGVKLRQRRQRRRRRREELQEEERRRQRVRFSAATLSQARLVPPPAGASALAPRLPRSRPLPGSGPARRWSHSRRGCQAWGERGAAVFPRHPPLDAPPACAWVGRPPLREDTKPVRPPPASSEPVPSSPTLGLESGSRPAPALSTRLSRSREGYAACVASFRWVYPGNSDPRAPSKRVLLWVGSPPTACGVLG